MPGNHGIHNLDLAIHFRFLGGAVPDEFDLKLLRGRKRTGLNGYPEHVRSALRHHPDHFSHRLFAADTQQHCARLSRR